MATIIMQRWGGALSLHNKTPAMFHIYMLWGIRSSQCITTKANHYVT